MTPEDQLAGFMAKYTPEIQTKAQAILEKMRAMLPGATEMVYDNYNALVCGFLPGDRVSEAIFSIALYPKWVNLFFLQGAGLPDPNNLLQGSGKLVRSIRLTCSEDLDRPEVRELIETALDFVKTPLDPTQPYRLIIKSVSAKQRPRVPTK